MITHGSLCTGYDGLGLALETIGPIRASWVADVDPAAQAILATRRPGVPNLGDVTGGASEHIAYERDLYTRVGVGRLSQLPDDGARLAWADALMRRTAHTKWNRVEPVDILTAGWPCQENSTAGKRAGQAGARHLWPAVAAAIGALKPQVFVGENVPGLLTIDAGERMREVLVDLNALGYTVRWTTVGACAVGACHHRHRVFFLATRDGGLPVPEGAMFGAPLASVRRWPQAGHVQVGELWPLPASVCGGAVGGVFPTPTARDAVHGAGWGDQPGRPLPEVIALLPTPTASDTTGAGHTGQGAANLRTVAVAFLPTPTASVSDGRGLPSTVLAEGRFDSGRRNLDDAIALLPTPTATDSHAGVGAGRRRDGRPGVPNLRTAVAESHGLHPTPKATSESHGGPNQRGSSGGPSLPTAAQPGRWGRWAVAVAAQEAAFGTRAPAATRIGVRGGPRLSHAFVEWMMGAPEGWVTGVPLGPDAQIKALGNGVVPAQAAYALKTLGIVELMSDLTRQLNTP